MQRRVAAVCAVIVGVLGAPLNSPADEKPRAAAEPKPQIIYGGSLILVVTGGRDRVWGYSPEVGRWSEQKLKAPVSDEGPTVSGTFATLQTPGDVYAYSALTGTWDSFAIPEGEKPEVVHLANMAVVQAGRQLYAFSPKAGKWAGIDLGER